MKKIIIYAVKWKQMCTLHSHHERSYIWNFTCTFYSISTPKNQNHMAAGFSRPRIFPTVLTTKKLLINANTTDLPWDSLVAMVSYITDDSIDLTTKRKWKFSYLIKITNGNCGENENVLIGNRNNELAAGAGISSYLNFASVARRDFDCIQKRLMSSVKWVTAL